MYIHSKNLLVAGILGKGLLSEGVVVQCMNEFYLPKLAGIVSVTI